jgi:hypothetical protein
VTHGSVLSNGGRGIRNKVEAHLVNPLARALFGLAAAVVFLVRPVCPIFWRRPRLPDSDTASSATTPCPSTYLEWILEEQPKLQQK